MRQPISGWTRLIVFSILSALVGSVSTFSASAMSAGESYPNWVVSSPNVAVEAMRRRDVLVNSILAANPEPQVLGDSIALSPGERSEDPRVPQAEIRIEVRSDLRQATQETRASREALALAKLKKNFVRARLQLTKLRARLAALQKKGLNLPESCTTALARAEAISQAVDAATTMTEAQAGGVSDYRNAVQQLNECRSIIARLGKVPGVLARADRTIRESETRWTRAKKAAAEQTDLVAEGDTILKGMKDARAAVVTALAQGDTDEMSALLERGVFSQVDDLKAVIEKIDAKKAPARYAAQHPARVAAIRATIARFKKMGHDTTRLEALLKRLEEKRLELKGQKAGTEAYAETVQDMSELSEEIAIESPATEDIDITLNVGGTTTATAGETLTVPEGL